jgi:abhydrolase domain-containing protein 15
MQIVLTFLVPQADLRYKRELLDLDDGGQAALDWALESSSHSVHDLAADAPIVVVLHGLTGCSAAMRSLCAEALERGYRPVVFNKRGHGGVKLTTPKLQAFGCVRDLQQAIAHIERAYPSAKLYGVGFSAGSGLLTSYLGETGAQSRLEAGVMVSPGYNALDLFCGGKIHPLYDFLMTFSLKQFLSRHVNELQDVIHVPSALKASSIREFDEHVFMKMHGYEDIETYWKHNNPMREVDRIQRPTLCINALDDPVCTKENIPYESFQEDPLRILIETAHGSHCAFYEGHVVLKSWALGVAMDYLTKVREFQGLVPPAQ